MFAEHMKRGNPWDENPFGNSVHRQGGECGSPGNHNSGSGTCSSEAGHFIPIRILEENLQNQMNDDDMDMEFGFDPKQQPINRIEIPDCFKQAQDEFRSKAAPRVKNIPPPLIQTEHNGRASSPFLDPGHHTTPIHSPNFNSNTVRHIPITVEGIQGKAPAPGTHIPTPPPPPQAKRNSSSRQNSPPPVKLDPIPMPAPPAHENSQNKPPSPPPRSPKNKNAHLKFENPNQGTTTASPSDDLKSSRAFPGANKPTSSATAHAQPIPINSNATAAPNQPFTNSNQPNFIPNPSPPNFNKTHAQSPSFNNLHAQTASIPITPAQSPSFNNLNAQSPNFNNMKPQSPSFSNLNAQSPNFSNLNAQSTNFSNLNAQSPNFNNAHAQNPNFGAPKVIHSPKFNSVPNRFTFNNVHAQNPTPAPQQSNSSTDESQSVPPPQKKPTPATSQLDKVDAVSQDVKELEKEITGFSGKSKNKEYLYLDEMLTRNLIKLDNIETEGREDVRNARKACIKLITKCIADLEAKLAANDASPPTPSGGGATEKTLVKANSEPPFHRNEVKIEIINPGEKKDPLPSAAAGADAGNKTNAAVKNDINAK